MNDENINPFDFDLRRVRLKPIENGVQYIYLLPTGEELVYERLAISPLGGGGGGGIWNIISQNGHIIVGGGGGGGGSWTQNQHYMGPTISSHRSSSPSKPIPFGLPQEMVEIFYKFVEKVENLSSHEKVEWIEKSVFNA